LGQAELLSIKVKAIVEQIQYLQLLHPSVEEAVAQIKAGNLLVAMEAAEVEQEA
jgi:hypothetical protein